MLLYTICGSYALDQRRYILDSIMVSMRKYVNIKLEEKDLKYLDDIAKNEKRSRRQVMCLILEQVIEKKQSDRDLSVKI